MKISVVIPTYNRATLLRNCLDSLVNQIYPKANYEIIVIDDGSKDGTELNLGDFYKKVSLTYVKQNNCGPSVARNLDIKNAIGEIIAFIDDDCIVDKNWLENIA